MFAAQDDESMSVATHRGSDRGSRASASAALPGATMRGLPGTIVATRPHAPSGTISHEPRRAKPGLLHRRCAASPGQRPNRRGASHHSVAMPWGSVIPGASIPELSADANRAKGANPGRRRRRIDGAWAANRQRVRADRMRSGMRIPPADRSTFAARADRGACARSIVTSVKQYIRSMPAGLAGSVRRGILT